MPTIAVFSSARDVVRADKVCRENGIQTKVMPLPEDLSSECGMCLQISDQALEKTKKLLDNQKIKTIFYER